jgi:integrase
LVWDDELKGLGVRITAAGVRAFVLQTRINGRTRRMTLGKYPGLTPEVARKRAQALIGEVATGGDPVAARARRKLQALTLEAAFKEYTTNRRRKKDGLALKERTRSDMMRALEESFADWKRRPVTNITTADVRQRYGERAKVSPTRAGVAFRYLRAVLNYAAVAHRDAEGRPLLSHNPVSDLSAAGLWHGAQRKRTVLSPDDLRRWVPAVEALADTPQREPGEGRKVPRLRHGKLHRDMLMFVALSGCRRGEALGLTRGDVDLKAGTVTFRDTKNRRDHTLPLTGELRAILERRLAESRTAEHVFASPFDGAPVTNLRVALGRVRKATGLAFTVHDLRRLAATSMERQGVPGYTVKAILNHLPSAGDVTAFYVVVDHAMMLDGLERFIFARSAEVVQLRRGAA